MTMKKQDGTESVQVVKKKPRGGNSPVIGNNGLMVNPGDNAKILEINIKLFNLKDIDMDDVDAVAERLTEYFRIYAESDFKPTVVGMALALNGHTRQWLWSVAHDKQTGSAGYGPALRPEVANLIKKAYFMMENQWETYMNSGKINPVSGIFLGKNNFGYQDKTEYVVTPNVQQDNDYDPNSIRERYMIEDKSASDSGSGSGSDFDSGAETDSDS